MNDTNANTLYIPLHRMFFVIVVAALTAGPVAAQGGGAQAGAGQGLAGGLNPDQAFEGGIERGGAVGESNAPAVGASATSAAAGAAGGGGAGGGGGGFGGGGLGGGGLGAAFGNLFNNNAAGGSSSTPPIRTRLRSADVLPPGITPSPNLVGHGSHGVPG